MSQLIKGWDKRPVVGVVALVALAIGFWGWLSNEPFVGNDCHHPLRHVYSPQRLKVVAECQQITFRVVAFRREHDNDVHVDGVVISGGVWVDAANVRGQHGMTVVEFVPGDPKPARFFAGQVLALTVTEVYDQQHKHADETNGWIEGHPVFKVKDVTPAGVVAQPNRPGLVTMDHDPAG